MTTFLLSISKALFRHPTGHADFDMAEITVEIVDVYVAFSLYLSGCECHSHSPFDEGFRIHYAFGSHIKRYECTNADGGTVVFARLNKTYCLSK